MTRFAAVAFAVALAWATVAGVGSLRALWLSVPGVQSGHRPVDDMIHVDVGRGWVGCVEEDPDCGPAESPGAWVETADFWIDRTEARVSDYRSCVRAGGCSTKGLQRPVWPGEEAHPELAWSCNWGRPGRESHPVNCVSWKQAVRYCRWVGKRLPTDAEWETAARGGRTWVYPWGDDALEGGSPRANLADVSLSTQMPDHAVLRGYQDGAVATAPVGSYPMGASPEGLLDMIGNVAEWVDDRAAGSKGIRSIKGGAWQATAETARVSWRDSAPKNVQPEYVGFRCARSEAG